MRAPSPARRALVGNSAAMNAVRALIAKVGPSDVTVVISGETGTGKDGVARALHAASRRAGKPFVAVDCGAISPSVLESELFGHVAGAFTGALRDRIGHVEAADGGTLFLDEIGDAPPAVQTHLLRVIQEREVTRVGTSKAIEVDIRIIAATLRNLEQEVSKGKFREDLYYRLKGVGISVPPLRNRLEDLGLLIAHFLVLNCEPDRLAIVSDEAHAALRAHPFRGNVRELEQMIVKAVALQPEGGTIEAHHLLEEPLAHEEDDDLPPMREHAEDGSWDRVLEEVLRIGLGLGWEEIKRGLTQASLDKNDGNIGEAALELGVNRSTLRRYQP